MHFVTRREAISLSTAALVAGSVNGQTENKPKDHVDESKDMKCVMEAGMTKEEAECWELVAKAAGKFFELPQQHPMDKQEVASAIHIVQNKLLSRPTYRKYLEAHKKGNAGGAEKK